jgi:NADH-quinone oxidoreductase subunit H
MSEPIWQASVARSIAIIIGVLVVTLTIAAGLIWLERRLLGLWQDRYGPNRVGPFGLMQVVADMIKIFTKEDWIPPFADKALFVLAPAVIEPPCCSPLPSSRSPPASSWRT